MAQFYIRVNERIESLTSWEETITRIDELNDLILDALKERSKFPVCGDYFKNTSKKELEAKGIDSLRWNLLYSEIVEKISPEGNYIEGESELEEVVEAESKLEELVHERIYIGRKVAEYKAQKGKETERKHREAKIIAHVRAYASENEMDPDAVEEIFVFLMEKNKYVQKLANTSRNGSFNKLKEVESCITVVSKEDHERIQGNNGYIPDNLMSIRRRLELEADRLQKETGESYYVTHSHQRDKKSILPVYAVKLIQE